MRARLVTTLTLNFVMVLLFIVVLMLPTWVYETNTGGGTVHYGLFYDLKIRNGKELITYSHEETIYDLHNDISDDEKKYFETAPMVFGIFGVLGGLALLVSTAFHIVIMARRVYSPRLRSFLITLQSISSMPLVFSVLFSISVMTVLEGTFYPHLNFYLGLMMVIISIVILILLFLEKRFDDVMIKKAKDVMPPIGFK